MPRRGASSTQANAEQRNDLLNFRHSSTPTRQSQNHHQQHRKSKSKPVSVQEINRRNKLKSEFYLQTSASHGFVLKRRGGATAKSKNLPSTGMNDNDDDQNYSFNGPDVGIKWDTVQLVKCMVEPTQDQYCPICLCMYVCPRVSKCGHSFCLSCILRYFYMVAASAPSGASGSNSGNNSSVVNAAVGAKCPCCFEPIYIDQFRSVQFHTIQPPSSKGACGANTMEFTLLNRSKTSFAPFRQNGGVKHVGQNSAPGESDADSMYCRFNYMDPKMRLDDLATELVILEESKHDSLDSTEVIFIHQAIEMVKLQQSALLSVSAREILLRERDDAKFNVILPATNDSGDHEPPFQDEIEAKSLSSDDAFQFFQASDGQLCFLSAFNMNCLKEEFTAHGRPLPEEIKGQVMETETYHLTVEARKRKPFLSHLPLFADVKFVEVNLNNILSPETKAKFKSEMDKRRARRKNRKNAEKREDKLAKKLEEARRKIPARVDPSDDFFKVGSFDSQSSFLDEDNFESSFPESALSSSPGRHPGAAAPASGDKTFSYNTVCATNGVWPGLESNSLSASPKTARQQSGAWGKSTAQPVSGQSAHLPVVSKKKKKGIKGKKIDIFSTGGGGRI